ncbi:MAG: AAA family ATPase [Bacteroidetes bacterium]|nr:AAA family ATPase [Bacteroidota bacterium]
MAKKRQTRRAAAPQSRTLSRLSLSPDHLRWLCHPEMLGITSMENVKPLKEIIGQNRALRALRLGLEMKHSGYNIFATGLPGTGKTTTIKRMLHEFEEKQADLTDKCYVHNFRDPDSPMIISLPAGQGCQLEKDMENIVAELLKAIPAVFESRRYLEQRKSLLEHFQDRQRSVLKDFEKRVKERGFEVVQVQGGTASRPEIAPVMDGNPVSIEQIHAKADAGEMTKEELNTILEQQADLEAQMDLVMREMRNIERKAKRSIDDLDHKIIVPVVKELLDELKGKYDSPQIHEYFEEVENDILDNSQRFHQKDDQQQSVLGIQVPKEEDAFIEYQVNVIVDNAGVKGMPVVIEKNPRYKNLFGTIERVVDRNGVWRTDFMRIKAGSLVKADGGFLVIDALDALTEPGVWVMLKRILRNNQIEIQSFESGLLGASSALKPEPIDLDVKVIMIGDPYIYNLLYHLDEDFREVFKIRADFDSEMPNEAESIRSYLSFIKTMCDQENLLSFDLSAVTEIVEYGVRLSGRQNKLSTQFSILADVIREASYWATKEHDREVTGEHVQKAVEERIERVRMIEEKIQEMIHEGSIMIDSVGATVGQVNGLSVYQLGEYEFGRPSRITAKTSMGRAGIINIEREAAMSGPTHNKGVLILSGYLRSTFAQDKPLVLSASIAFEQSYSGIDGDSASSTEVYAIISSLSGVPLRQDIAVTGSINQHGEIQPIGGVNQKVEGFFDVCAARGLTGTQGVVMPHQNVNDLMLRHDVVQAVREKQFHIYAVKSIEDGLEILTGKPAGTRLKTGRFSAGSVFALADARLREFTKGQKKQNAP